MPLVQGAEPTELGNVARLPEQTPEPETSDGALNVVSSGLRTSNVASSAYDRLYNYPRPDAKAVPGFDPLTSVPAGYEKYADKFLNAESPDDMAWIKQRIDAEQNDKQTIARAGKWGFAASMAAGLTDPVTLASMVIPGGGETRLIQAGRMAAIAAGTSAVQEGVMHTLSPTRTGEESAFNIAGSAVLGGILGAAIRPHVPSRTADALGEGLSAELHTDTPAKLLGPEQRTVLDTALPSDHPQTTAEIEFGRLHEEIQSRLAQQESTLREAAEGNEARALSFRGEGGLSRVSQNLQAGRASLDEAAKVLSADRTEQVATEAQRLAQSDQGNAYAQARAGEAGEEKAVFPKWQERAETNVDRMRANAELQAEQARAVIKTNREDVFRYNKVAAAGADLEQLRYGRAQAKTPEELAQLLPQGQREFYGQRLATTRADLANEPRPIAPAESNVSSVVEPTQEHINPNAESTAGAAAVAQPGLAGERIARGAQTIAEGPIGKVAPGLRVMTSDSLEARRLVQQLANTPEMLEKNYAGVATAQPIERNLWKQEGTWYEGLKARSEGFKTYRERMAGGDTPALSRREFGRQISAAMRRGDSHEIPEVAKAAADTRRIVFDPLKVRAQKLGLLPAEVEAKGADSYLTRQYDARAIRENMSKWRDTLTEGFHAQGVDIAEARDIAHKVTRNVLGSERGTMDWHVLDDIVPQSGRMKERTLNLPDKLLEPFLNSDIDHLSHSYIRSMAPEVEFTERFGSRDMKDQFDAINDEYARLKEQAEARGIDSAALDKQQDAVIRDLSAIRDRLYGNYGQPKDPGAFMVRAGRMLRADNALRLLGAATLAHFPDIGNVIARYGMPQTFGAIAKVLTNSAAMSLTRSEAKRMGAALDMVMNVTSSILGDYGSHSQFAEQRFMARATRAFTIGTGETPLITAVQSLTSTLAQDELLRSAEKIAGGGELGVARSARLASAGIDAAMLKRFAAQSQFTQKAGGLRFGMTDKWTDSEAAAAFESAVLKEAHGVTLRPGAGDTPLFMSGELGKLILQFKTFAFASSRIVVNPMLQGISHGDANSVQGLFALAFMGTASYVAKQTAAGQPVELDSPGRLAMEVLDKSNLLGWTGEMVFPALWQMGMKDLSRWSDRDATETLLGPSAGTVADTYERRFPSKLTADTENGEKGFSRSDLHFMRRLMPGQNLWYFRRGVNALEDAVGDAFDLPGQSNADRAAQVAAN